MRVRRHRAVSRIQAEVRRGVLRYKLKCLCVAAAVRRRKRQLQLLPRIQKLARGAQTRVWVQQLRIRRDIATRLWQRLWRGLRGRKRARAARRRAARSEEMRQKAALARVEKACGSGAPPVGRALLLLRPPAVAAGVHEDEDGSIAHMLNRRGLRIVRRRVMAPYWAEEEVRTFVGERYAALPSSAYARELQALSAEPGCVAWLLEHDGGDQLAVRELERILGPKDPRQARRVSPGSLRGRFAEAMDGISGGAQMH